MMKEASVARIRIIRGLRSESASLFHFRQANWPRSHLPMSIASRLETADRNFLLQAADPELRKREIVRLTRYRQMYFVFAALMSLMFMVLMIGYCVHAVARSAGILRHDLSPSPVPESDSSELFGLVITLFVLLLQMRSFYEAHHKVRLLLLTEQICGSRSVSGS
jgi:hypothetical protein